MAVPDCASSYSVLVTFELEAPDAASPCSVAATEEARRADIVSLSKLCDRLATKSSIGKVQNIKIGANTLEICAQTKRGTTGILKNVKIPEVCCEVVAQQKGATNQSIAVATAG